jgi:hypothetical protein
MWNCCKKGNKPNSLNKRVSTKRKFLMNTLLTRLATFLLDLNVGATAIERFLLLAPAQDNIQVKFDKDTSIEGIKFLLQIEDRIWAQNKYGTIVIVNIMPSIKPTLSYFQHNLTMEFQFNCTIEGKPTISWVQLSLNMNEETLT